MSLFDDLQPAKYAPFSSETYVVPGPWHPLRNNDFGNDDADGRIFQFDKTCRRYLDEKQAALLNDKDKYVCRERLPNDDGSKQIEISERLPIYAAVIEFMVNRLSKEYPDLEPKDTRSGKRELEFPTGKKLLFSGDWLLGDESIDQHGPFPATLDALAEQLQEDVAIMRRTKSGENSLLYTHVCLPSGWLPRSKIGRSFAEIHLPVRRFETAKTKEADHVSTMIQSDRDHRVRFVWSIQFDAKLNQPSPPRNRTPFDPAQPAGWLRVERQTFTGFPHPDAVLFTIRIYVTDLNRICSDASTCDQLCKAIRSMQDADLEYKRLIDCRDELLKWIESLPG